MSFILVDCSLDTAIYAIRDYAPNEINTMTVTGADLATFLALPLSRKIPISHPRLSRSSVLNVSTLFEVIPNCGAEDFSDFAIAFDVNSLNHDVQEFSEKLTLKIATSITGAFWARIGTLTGSLSISVALNKAERKSTSKTTERTTRPNETAFLNGSFLVFKAEHKDNISKIQEARDELLTKTTPFNQFQFGCYRYLPVCAAAGYFMEFALVDVMLRQYHALSEPLDTKSAQNRAKLFSQSLNILRYVKNLAPNIPFNTALPTFQALNGIVFHETYIVKDVQDDHTAPAALYAALQNGVAKSVKVTHLRNKKRLRIEPLGLKISEGGAHLIKDEMKCALRCILLCLADLHSRQFVHRDLRWSNIIRSYTYCNSADPVCNGQPESMTFLVIDFEYGAQSGESLDVDGHWLIVRHHDLFDVNKIYTYTHDLCSVAMMLLKWFSTNGESLDNDVSAFVSYLECEGATAAVALLQPWIVHVADIIYYT